MSVDRVDGYPEPVRRRHGACARADGTPKIAYATRAEAEAVLQGNDQRVYRCQSDHWHVGRRAPR